MTHLKAKPFLILFISFLTLCSKSFSQNVGEWNSYPSLNSIQHVLVDNDGISWASTSGGLFADTEPFKKITPIEGLHKPEATAFHYDSDSGLFWIGFNDGVLQSYNPTTNVFFTYPDISRSTRFNSKSINEIRQIDDGLVLSVDFGLIIWDVNRNIVLESFSNFGTIGSGLKINSSVLMGDTLFLGSPSGLIWGSYSDDLVLPSAWKSITTGSTSLQSSVTSLGKLSSDTLFLSTTDQNLKYFKGLIQNNSTIPQVIKRYHNSESKLLAITATKVYSKTTSTPFSTIFTTSTSGTTLSDAFLQNQTVLIGTLSESLIQYNLDSNQETPIKPEGPYLNFFSEMKIGNGVLISASTFSPGKVASTIRESGFYLFDGTTWQNFNSKTSSVLPNNSSNSFYVSALSESYYAFGSWGNGILLYSNSDQNLELFNPKNTPEISGITGASDFMVVTGLDFDSNENLWATNFLNTNKALYKYNPSAKEWTSFSLTPFISSGDNYFGLTIDSFNQLWIPLVSSAEDGRGLLVLSLGDVANLNDDKAFQLTSATDKGFLPSDQVTAISQDKRGEMWVGTTRGLVRYLFPERIIDGNSNDRRAEYLRNTAGDSTYFRDIDVTSIAVDAANQKWIGTASNGVWHIAENGDRIIKQFTVTNSPLPSNSIRSIAIDDRNGLIYIATDLGLVSFVDVTTESYTSRSTLKVYPNPLVYDNLDQNRVIIEGLADETVVRVVSTSGTLIDELDVKGGRVQWTPLTKEGKKLASGVYFIISVTKEGNKTAVGKLAVIR